MSRRKNAAPAAATIDLIATVLRHGQRFVSPAAEIVEAAEWLANLGIVEVRQCLAVCCSNPIDEDFPPSARHCEGFVVLRDQADEGGGDYRCPNCERIVYPDAYRKERIETLTVLLNRPGIETFLIKHCGEEARGRQFDDGVLTIPMESMNASICLPEFCSDSLLLRRGTAISQTSIYVTVEPDAARRMLKDVGIAHVALPQVLVGQINLCDHLRNRMRSGPAVCSSVDVPVYGFGNTSIGPRIEPVPLPRRFTVNLTSEGFWVDGLLVVKAERRTAILILKALVQRFGTDLIAGSSIRAMSVDEIADAVESAGDQETEEKRDADSIRRTTDRVRGGIADVIRKTAGKPIGEHDVIENVSRSGVGKGAAGYRLNPQTVTLAASTP